jgi:hypothetical protein
MTLGRLGRESLSGRTLGRVARLQAARREHGVSFRRTQPFRQAARRCKAGRRRLCAGIATYERRRTAPAAAEPAPATPLIALKCLHFFHERLGKS